MLLERLDRANGDFHDDNEKCSAIISLNGKQLGVVAEHFLKKRKNR